MPLPPYVIRITITVSRSSKVNAAYIHRYLSNQHYSVSVLEFCISAVMDLIVSKNIFAPNGMDLVASVG
jgi:hypothetical protein